MTAKYKDEQGRFLTAGLFKETNTSPNYTPPFTLKEDDVGEYKSMRKLYLGYEDPTEYEFAMAVLGSWDHWQKLCNTGWFKPYLEVWRNELEIKLRSRAIKQVARIAKDKDSAARWLAEGKWRENKRGRPSKDEVERQKKIAAGIESDTEEDLKRLGLH